jgi:hypothetical protein
MSVIDSGFDGGIIDTKRKEQLEQEYATEFNKMKDETNFIIAAKNFWKNYGFLPSKITNGWLFDDWYKIYQAVRDLFIDEKYNRFEQDIISGMKGSVKSFNNFMTLYRLFEGNRDETDFYLYKMMEVSRTFNDLNWICCLAPKKHEVAISAIRQMDEIEFKTDWQKKAIRTAKQKHIE